MRGRKWFFCSGLPKPMMTGPTILTPITLTFGAPARAHSASKIQRCAGVQSGPPCSPGRPGAPQPLLCRDFCQAMPISGSENTEGVRAWARFISGVRFSAMKSRTSFSKPRSSALKVRSMAASSSGLLYPLAEDGVAAKVMCAAAKHRIEGEQPLEIRAYVEFFGDPHGAVKLHRLFGDEACALADLGLGARSGAAARDLLGVSHQRRAQGDRTRFVTLHRHVGEPVPDHLVRRKRPPKLLAHLGIFERPVEHGLHDTNRLRAECRECAVNGGLDF